MSERIIQKKAKIDRRHTIHSRASDASDSRLSSNTRLSFGELRRESTKHENEDVKPQSTLFLKKSTTLHNTKSKQGLGLINDDDDGDHSEDSFKEDSDYE